MYDHPTDPTPDDPAADWLGFIRDAVAEGKLAPEVLDGAQQAAALRAAQEQTPTEKPYTIGVSAGYLLETGRWDDACRMTGTSEWAVNEGQMDRYEHLTLTIDQAKEIGLLPTPRSW